MTTLCIDGENGKLYADSRASWGGRWELIAGLIPLKIPFMYEDDYDHKIEKLDNKVYMLGCGRVSILDYMKMCLRTGEVINVPPKYLLDDDCASRIFLVTKVGEDVYIEMISLEVKKGFFRTKYSLGRKWYKNKTIFSGSGGKHAFASWNREKGDYKDDCLHAMYVAKQLDKYSGGEIHEVAL